MQALHGVARKALRSLVRGSRMHRRLSFSYPVASAQHLLLCRHRLAHLRSNVGVSQILQRCEVHIYIQYRHEHTCIFKRCIDWCFLVARNFVTQPAAVLQMTVREALNSALDEEMTRDPTVFLIGEEVRRLHFR